LKEDILEQLVDDYLMHKGYFTRHNIRFKPSRNHAEYISKQDSVASDIDVIAVHPRQQGAERVIVVSCKSWQGGFDPAAKISEIRRGKKVAGRDAWRGFRELVIPKWAEAFVSKVEEVTGSHEFTYWIVVTRLLNPDSRNLWEQDDEFKRALGGNSIRIVQLSEMLSSLWSSLTQTPAASEIGRSLQLMKASGWHAPTHVDAIHRGASRLVICLSNVIIKIPRPDNWAEGVRANLGEIEWSQRRFKELCPVTSFAKNGEWLVMPRCRIMKRAEFTNNFYQEFGDNLRDEEGRQISLNVEAKPGSFGWLDGRWVAVDFG
jgi:hypothetical protein